MHSHHVHLPWIHTHIYYIHAQKCRLYLLNHVCKCETLQKLVNFQLLNPSNTNWNNTTIKMLNPPSYYNIGNRYLNILHTRIRNNCSALHNDLFHANLIHSPSCSCGYFRECWTFFIVLQEVWCTQKYFVPFFISCKCTPCCLEVKFIILTQIGMYSLLYRHILRKHVAFFPRWLSWM